jgi:uncharacterized protein (DUF2235 family)
MPRQLIVCCDGTNSNFTGRDHDTNVVKLCEVLEAYPDRERLVFYQPGVGNAGMFPGASLGGKVKVVWSRLQGLAFGSGVFENIAETYRFLVDNYQPGDQIFLFGFSRGAFTARAVAGMVNLFGLIDRQMVSMLPTLVATYFAKKTPEENKAATDPKASMRRKWMPLVKRETIAEQIKRLLSSGNRQIVDIQFIGVWDTVATIGVRPFDISFTSNPSVDQKCFRNVRHALALDEHRSQFAPRLYSEKNTNELSKLKTKSGYPVTLKQVWFRGNHCDVGGGHSAQESQLSRITLAWMLAEATACGLRLSSIAVLPQPLSENAASAVIDGINSLRTPSTQPIWVHSDLYDVSVWAASGMAVRDQLHSLDKTTSGQKLQPEMHHSVSSPTAPAVQSLWEKCRWHTHRNATIFFLISLLLVMALPLFQSLALDSSYCFEPLRWAKLVTQLCDQLSNKLTELRDFVVWQLLWWLPYVHEGFKPCIINLKSMTSIHWVLWWDFCLIAVYTFTFSWISACRFEKCVGLTIKDASAFGCLNRLSGIGQHGPWGLGNGLTLLILADLSENILTALVVAFWSIQWSYTAYFFGILMSLASGLKLYALLHVLALMLLPRCMLVRR